MLCSVSTDRLTFASSNRSPEGGVSDQPTQKCGPQNHVSNTPMEFSLPASLVPATERHGWHASAGLHFFVPSDVRESSPTSTAIPRGLRGNQTAVWTDQTNEYVIPHLQRRRTASRPLSTVNREMPRR